MNCMLLPALTVPDPVASGPVQVTVAVRVAAIGVISFARLGSDDQPTRTPTDHPRGDRLTSLLELPARIGRLGSEARARADRLLDVRVVTGRTDPPRELEPWLERTFGSADAVREQAVIKVTNLATLEATLFAPLRARRPMDGPPPGDDLDAEIAAAASGPFCSPETETPAHTYGRARGARMVSGANAALADAHHAVLVFDAHDPLAFDAELVTDLFATGRSWAELARAADPAAANYLLAWNCLWRAGGSIVHGHAQAFLGAGPHYAALERFRRAATAYESSHGTGLALDLVALHRDLGLAADRGGGVAILAHLTPVKEREVLVIGSPGMDEREPAFTDAVAHALIACRDRLGVRSFNLALWRPPLDAAPGAPPGWEEIPPIVRIVDRGDPFARSSDIGAMELYGTPIVGTDPYEVFESVR
ncbi:MAG TPA: hypothetical protein VMP86_07880 [Candidatus Binatia bacterium]|nr:hypothetical protein [Candidatus Binatia bacterium]